MKPVLFFSHRSNDKARAAEIVEALEQSGAMLTTFDVDDLQQGEEWKPQLVRWLTRCDAGFVLLTRNVMEQPAWVLQEATILRTRLIEERRSFRLFLLIDADAQTHPNWTLFKPLDLGAVQRLARDSTAAQVAAAVAPRMLEIEPAEWTYFVRLERMLQGLLAPIVDKDPAAEDFLNRELQLADTRWKSIIGGVDAVAHRAAQRLCQGDLGNFATLQSLFVKLRHVPLRENKLSLLNVLRAYWIELHTLAGLADVIGGQAPRLVVVQTDRALISIDMCVERQYIPYGEMPEIIRIGGGNEPPQIGDVIAACRALNQNPYAPSDDAAYQKMLQDDVTELQLRRVVLLPSMNDIESAMALVDAFPMFSFIMPTALDLQAKALRAGAVWLSLKRSGADGHGEESHTSDYYYALGRI